MFEVIAIGPFFVWTRLVFLLIGLWLSTEFFLRLARGANLSLQHFQDHVWHYAGAFVLCGRLAAIIAEYRIYVQDPLRVFILWDGGFSFLGGAIGVGLVLYWVTKAHRSIFLQWLDVLLPATTLGLVFDWLGKFASGKAYGKPTDVFWGVTYDAMNVRYVVPVHPVQLYYAVFFILLTFFLLIIRKHAVRAGSETLWGIVLAGVATFAFEIFRGDFAIPLFANKMDFVMIAALFVSLGLLAVIERSLTQKGMYIYAAVLIVVFGGYLLLRPSLPFAMFELRFSQFLAVLALLATVVYVVVERRKHPHL